MITLLAFRHLFVRRVRALVLLLGFAIGVGVMIVLLSVGEAMLAQSRDVALVGGGEVTVLPQGIDIEAMRSGGLSGMFFGIDRARFVGRELLGGPRQAGTVAAVAPAIEQKVLYLTARDGRTTAVRAGGEIPSAARAAGAGLDVRAGRWEDTAEDSAWMRPTAQQLYDQLDRFHVPPFRDSTWAEWHYFNVLVSADEWWYVTFLVGGEVPDGRWGGQLLITRRRPDGVHETYTSPVEPAAIALDTTRADLRLGPHAVVQREGTYRLRGRATGPAGTAEVDLALVPAARQYFPPVELSADRFLSGYVVPALDARARGRLCLDGRCRDVAEVPAYHDHNWGVWRDVTWEWGAARGPAFRLLYGGVQRGDSAVGGAPFFLALLDSLGTRQVLRFRTIAYEGARPVPGSRARAPERFTLVAARERDTVRLRAEVLAAHATRQQAAAYERYFVQLRARYILDGRLGGQPVRDAGEGFFETYVRGRE